MRTVAIALLGLVVSIALSGEAGAQVDLTATGGTPAASYATLKAAFDAINAGTHTGLIDIQITGNTAEAASCVLYGSGGASSYSQVSIRPAGGALRTISGTIAGPLVDLNGADNVLIDGLETGGDALTLENLSTAGGYGYSTGPSTVRFINDATANTLQNLSLKGSCGTSPAAQSATIYFGSSGTGLGNDDNTITNCDIGPAGSTLPVSALWALGHATASRHNSGVVISNNRFHDWFFAGGGSTGMYVINGNTDWTITGNSFYQTAPRTQTGLTGTTHYAIYVSNNVGASNFTISDNFVGGSAPGAGGSAWTLSGIYAANFVGIYVSVITGSLQGNTVANFAWSTNGDWRGIQVARGTVGLGTVAGNTVGAGTGTGSVVLTGNLAGKQAIGIDAASASGSVTVANNVVGAITTAGGSAAVSISLTGILAGTNVIAITGNSVGSAATPASLQASNASTSATAQAVTGISASATATISDNLVANLQNAYAGTGAAGQVRGIVASAGASTVTGNTVRDLSGAGGPTGTGAAAAVLGIGQTAAGGAQNVAGNLVHSLASTHASAAVNVVGLHYAGPTSGTNVVAGNFVHSLSLASSSASAALVGINAAGGVASFRNNMVRLGIDAAGDPVTAACAITGIAKATANAQSFYHNSVWVGGTGVGAGAANSYAFRRTTTGTDDIRNNLFANRRQNAGAGGRHFAFVLNAPATATVDHNVYYVAPGNPDLWSLDGGATAVATLQALRNAPGYGQDAHSGVGDPNFAAPDAAAGSVSLALQGPTPAEGSGTEIAAVTDDFDGELRSGLTPADIGADAGLFSLDAATDVFTPSIAYTSLTNTSLLGDRVLAATLTDMAPAGGGVPTAGSNRPRIWYKKATDAIWTLSSPGVLVAGDGADGAWEFTIEAAGLAPTVGDVIQYYVVAQDQATTPNLWYRPVAAGDPFHTDVSTQTVPPSMPDSYAITEALAGTYWLPNDPGGQAARVFPSLTAAGGFFAAVNGQPLAADVTLVVNGDVSIEDGTNKLAQWIEDGAGGWTITIQPDGASPRTLSGSGVAAGVPMIEIFGADRVTFDGSYAGEGRHLVLRNTNVTAASTGATIQFNNGSLGCALRNCVVESNGTTATRGAVVVAETGANSGLAITGNEIRDATAGTAGSPANGIYANAAASESLHVANNLIFNWTGSGVRLAAIGNGAVISGNSFYNDLAVPPATAQTAILVGGTGTGHEVSGNWVGGQAPQCGGGAWVNTGSVAFVGISVASGTAAPSDLQGNTIQNVRLTGAAAASFTGIDCTAGAVRVGTTAGNTVGHASLAASIEVAGASSGAIRGIRVASTVPVEVSGNLIANIAVTNAGSTAAFRGLELAPGGGASSVQGNVVRNVSLAGTGASSFAGIYASSGVIDLGGTAGNTVGHASEAGSIQLAGTGASYGVHIVSATAGQTVANNLVANVAAAGNATFYALHVGAPWNGAGNRIEQNSVHHVSLASTGTTVEFRGISLVGAGTNPTYGAGGTEIVENTIGDEILADCILVAGGGGTSGIYTYGYDTATIGVRENLIANLTASGTGAAVSLRGIYHDRGIAAIVGNDIHDLASASSSVNAANTGAVIGIYADMGMISTTYTDNYVEGNSLRALRATNGGAVATIAAGLVTGSGSAYSRGHALRNRIRDLTNASTSASAWVRGINEYLGSWTAANNQISLTNAPATGPMQIAGIYQGSAGYCYFNSVRIGGLQESGSANSYAYVRPANVGIILLDNLFYNERANVGAASGSHVAIANLYASFGIWSDSDHNVLIATDPAAIGRFNTTDLDLAGWQGTSGDDYNSLGESAGAITSAALFVDATAGDLDIRPTAGYDAPPIVSNAGSPVAGQTTDFGGSDLRSSYPDIGADEIEVDRGLPGPGILLPAAAAYPGHYDEVMVLAGSAPTLGGDVHFFGTLALGDVITTGPYTVTVRPSGTIVRGDGHVDGNLRKHVAAGEDVLQTFELGLPSGYGPVAVAFDTVSVEGYVLASGVAGDHPQLGSSGLDPAFSANRHWTLLNESVGFTTCDATFTFVAGDLDPGANPALFAVGQFDDPSWATPVVGSRTATSVQATGLTGFSAFALAKPVGTVMNDFGDAPDPTYPTLAANGGAYHAIVAGYHLGGGVDDELDGQPGADSDGDDHAGAADEDGVVLAGPLHPGGIATVYVTASAAGYLDAWVDFDLDGDWLDAHDQVFASQPLAAGTDTLTFAVPVVSQGPGYTHARFRFSSAGGLAATGGAADGEVEDHHLFILGNLSGAELPPLSFSLSVSPNPFNPRTTVRFDLPTAERVRLQIFDVGGRLVGTLLDDRREAGSHQVAWDGRGDSGRSVASGIYFCRIEAGQHRRTERMTLVR